MSRFRANPEGIFELPEDVVPGPEQEAALADAERAMKHESYLNERHPFHRQQVEGVQDLLTAAHGTEEEIEERLKKRGGG